MPTFRDLTYQSPALSFAVSKSCWAGLVLAKLPVGLAGVVPSGVESSSLGSNVGGSAPEEELEEGFSGLGEIFVSVGVGLGALEVSVSKAEGLLG